MMKLKLAIFMVSMTLSLGAQTQSPCSSLKAHEFDFWLGDWTVYKYGTDKVIGYNTIVPVANGCGVQENWRSANGASVGTSLNKYAFNKKKWQQFWIDNSGQTLELEGNYVDNKMVMTSAPLDASTIAPTISRITWFNNSDGTVRQLWEQSIDKGQTWTVAFDGLYKK